MTKPVKTIQETFNLVWAGLAAQNWQPSMDKSQGAEACAYRGEEGRKCAAGILIPDDRYSSEFEGYTVSICNLSEIDEEDPSDRIAKILLEEGHQLDFVSACQSAHDNDEGADRSLYDRFISLASHYGLTIPADA